MNRPSEQPEISLISRQIVLTAREVAEQLLPVLVREEVDAQVRKPLHMKDIAKRYGVCTLTAWRWWKRGLLPEPMPRIGRKITWDSTTIDAHIRGLLEVKHKNGQKFFDSPQNVQQAPEPPQTSIPPT